MSGCPISLAKSKMYLWCKEEIKGIETTTTTATTTMKNNKKLPKTSTFKKMFMRDCVAIKEKIILSKSF